MKKTMLQKTSLSEFSDDYAEYNRAELEIESKILLVYEIGGNEEYEVLPSPAPEFLVAVVVRK